MDYPFPILRLPFVPLQEIFKAMDTFEIINFSLITKRTKTVTQNMIIYSGCSIQLDINKELEVWVVGPKNMTSCYYSFTLNEEMNGKIVENDWNDWNELQIWKYSNNPIEEWKLLCKHVLEIFKIQTIDYLSMTMDSFVDHNVSIIDFLKTNVKSVTECCLSQINKNINVDEHTAYLLDNIIINAELCFALSINNVNFNWKIPKNLKELCIHNSHWIGYERLFDIDCKSVILEKNRISNKVWNLFFKKWIAMETNQNLEYLQLDYREIEEFRALVLDDIPHEVVDEGVQRVLKTRHNETKEVKGGIDIRRIDGKTATFFMLGWNGSFLMCIH
ncbi:hypothetical protein CRE_19527 [Caenorhabditis remanei]|uniref:F-box domain-containing protein n=1 Tax=Caenorhabditis remanei TaxID=31234 RepID=E3NI07_CAERE|nr:hypothetical protein CRE_19527 [Caenorhabditis remanei]